MPQGSTNHILQWKLYNVSIDLTYSFCDDPFQESRLSSVLRMGKARKKSNHREEIDSLEALPSDSHQMSWLDIP